MIARLALGSIFGLAFLGIFAVAATLDHQPYTVGYRMFAIIFGICFGMILFGRGAA